MAAHQALIPHTRSQSQRDALEAALLDRVSDLEVVTTDSPDRTIEALETADVLVTMGFEDDWYECLESISWVQALSSGVNQYDRERLEAAGVVLTNAAGVHGRPIAEQVLGYLLAFERNLLRAVHQQRRGEWERFGAGELGDKTVGVVGLGAIGSTVATFCDALGVRVLGVRRDPSKAVPGVEKIYGPDEISSFYADLDYLVLACPLTDQTRGLVDASALETLSADAVVVNIARGEVIDESALIDALESGAIGGAALDVFETEPLPEDSPLWDMENVLVTPHMAGSTPHYWERCADLFARNYAAFAAGDRDGMPTLIR